MTIRQLAVSSKSFDPAEQIEGVCDEIDKAMIVAEDAVRRERHGRAAGNLTQIY